MKNYVIDTSILEKPDWKNKVCYVDFETQSAVNLRKVGSIAYINHPSTRIMSAVFKTPKEMIVWTPHYTGFYSTVAKLSEVVTKSHSGGVPKDVIEICKKYTLVGHNAEMFDALLFATKYPNIKAKWIDTIHLCRAAGIPAGLNDALQAIGRAGKTDNRAMEILSQARIGPGGFPVYPVGTPPLWESMVDYNINDTVELEYLLTYLVEQKVNEVEVIRKHAAINANGFKVDRDYTRHLRNLWHDMQSKSKDEISRITCNALQYNPHTGKHDIASPSKVKAWLISQGFRLPDNSLNTQTVNQILLHPENYITGIGEETGESIIALLAERQNAVRATTGKLDTMLETAGPGGEVTHWRNHYGAHTGRSSARGINPLNMPRGVKLKKKPGLDELLALRCKLQLTDIEAARDANNLPGNPVNVSDVLTTLTRSVIVPDKGNKFLILDYMQIEARVLAWVAGCNPLLALYRDPHKDVYCDMGTKLFGRVITPKDEKERFISKQVVLASGYQASANKLGLMFRIWNVDLQSVGLTPQDCTNAYRKGYPEIPKLWKDINLNALLAVRCPGQIFRSGHCNLQWVDGWLFIELPSGRKLRYRNASITRGLAPWGETIDQISYQTGYGYWKKLYGGILTENIVQAISRDILWDGMLRQKQIPTLDVYDEVVYQCKASNAGRQLDSICKAMSMPPAWANNLPLGVEGHTAPCYTKSKISGEKSVAYLVGKKIAE